MANIDLSLRLGKNAVVEGREDIVPFVISVKGVKSTSPPVAFIIAIDSSLSMDGEKIFRAKQAAIKTINLLRENDLVTIYGFHRKVLKVVDKAPGSEKEKLEEAIASLKLGYGTNIYAVLEEMVREAREYSSRKDIASVRAIFITDGEPTVGPKKPEKIVGVAKKLRETGVSGLIIGVGTEYNERMLLDIADALDGVFEHVSKSGKLMELLSQYTLTAKEVSAKDIVVQVKTAPNYRVFIYGREASVSSGGVDIKIGDIHYREIVDVIGDLIVPSSEQGVLDIGVVTAKYVDPETNNTEYVPPKPVRLKVLPPHLAPTIAVSEEVYAEVRAIRAAQHLRERLGKERVEEVYRELEEIAEATMRLGSQTLYSRTLSIKHRIEREGLTSDVSKELASIISKLISGKIEKEGGRSE